VAVILDIDEYRRLLRDCGDETDLKNGGKGSRYDFSDLLGTLTWRGDAVAEQRRLRDEW
jgi:hypothetical protein